MKFLLKLAYPLTKLTLNLLISRICPDNFKKIYPNGVTYESWEAHLDIIKVKDKDSYYALIILPNLIYIASIISIVTLWYIK